MYIIIPHLLSSCLYLFTINNFMFTKAKDMNVTSIEDIDFFRVEGDAYKFKTRDNERQCLAYIGDISIGNIKQAYTCNKPNCYTFLSPTECMPLDDIDDLDYAYEHNSFAFQREGLTCDLSNEDIGDVGDGATCKYLVDQKCELFHVDIDCQDITLIQEDEGTDTHDTIVPDEIEENSHNEIDDSDNEVVDVHVEGNHGDFGDEGDDNDTEEEEEENIIDVDSEENDNEYNTIQEDSIIEDDDEIVDTREYITYDQEGEDDQLEDDEEL